MKTIEVKQKQITETIERCSLMAEAINKAIELLKDKVQESITTELIYKIVYSEYPKSDVIGNFVSSFFSKVV